jgi:hypothetical protein
MLGLSATVPRIALLLPVRALEAQAAHKVPAGPATFHNSTGQKSFSDALRLWKESSGRRGNLLVECDLSRSRDGQERTRKNKSGRAYRTLVLGAE